MRKLIFVFLWILSLPLAAAPAFEDLSFDEKLGQTLVVFVDVDSAELVLNNYPSPLRQTLKPYETRVYLWK